MVAVMAPQSPPTNEGAVLIVPRDTGPNFADSTLPLHVIEAGMAVQDQIHDDTVNYVAGETTDWDQGMVAVAIYRAMTEAGAAHPHPVQDAGMRAEVFDIVQDACLAVVASEETTGSAAAASDLEQITRERDAAVGLLREIVSEPGIECIPDAEIQVRVTALLSRLAATPKP